MCSRLGSWPRSVCIIRAVAVLSTFCIGNVRADDYKWIALPGPPSPGVTWGLPMNWTNLSGPVPAFPGAADTATFTDLYGVGGSHYNVFFSPFPPPSNVTTSKVTVASGTYDFWFLGIDPDAALHVTAVDGLVVGQGMGTTAALGDGANGPGGSIYANGTVIARDTSVGTLNIANPGGMLNDSHQITVGKTGNGTLNVSIGGVAQTTGGIVVGDEMNSFGLMQVQSAGKVTSGDLLAVGNNEGSIGQVIVNGSGSQVESQWTAIGRYGIGDVQILNGGLMTTVNKVSIGDLPLSTGTVEIDGIDSTLDAKGWMDVGSQGYGELTVTDGGTSKGGSMFVGGSNVLGAEGHVVASGDGSTLSHGWLNIGTHNLGTLLVEDGAYANSLSAVHAGDGADGHGEIRVTGEDSLLEADWYFAIGATGYGTLTIEDGAEGRAHNGIYIGSNGVNSDGTVTVTGTGSNLSANWGIGVGGAGHGALTVSDGGTVSAHDGLETGYEVQSDGEILVTGNGSTVSAGWGINAGHAGTGTVTFENGGGAPSLPAINVALDPGSHGTLNIGAGAAVPTATSYVMTNELYVGGAWYQVGGTGVVNVKTDGDLTVNYTLAAYDNPGNQINFEGGTIHTPSINLNGNPSILHWTAGRLHITNDVTFDPAAGDTTTSAAFGDALIVGDHQELQGANNFTLGGVEPFSLTVNSGGTVEVTSLVVSPTGELHGDGAVAANVQNEGLVSPGNSPGALHITGNYTQTSSGELVIQIESGASYDALDINGVAILAGTLTVELLGGFHPTSGQSFDILDFISATPGFSTLDLPGLDSGLTWDSSQLYVSGALSVVSSELPGDFNHDHHVDVADYVLWRKTDSANTDHYLDWVHHYGESSMGGDATQRGPENGVPEPKSWLLLLSLPVIATAAGRLQRQ